MRGRENTEPRPMCRDCHNTDTDPVTMSGFSLTLERHYVSGHESGHDVRIQLLPHHFYRQNGKSDNPKDTISTHAAMKIHA